MTDTPISQADSLWKDLVSEFDTEFILFFFGKLLHDAIDFSVANVQGWHVQYVQSVIDKFEKKA